MECSDIQLKPVRFSEPDRFFCRKFMFIHKLYVKKYYICPYKFVIMDSKLTLKLNKNVIEKAKQFAKQNNISLSRLIENYLMAITKNKDDDQNISPLVKSLTGVIKLEEEDYKKDYTDFLNKKYS